MPCMVSIRFQQESTFRDFLVAQWLRLCAPDAGGLGSIPGQGTRSHTQQLRVHMPQLRPGTNKYFFKINKNATLKKHL